MQSIFKPWKDYIRLENPVEAAATCQLACGKNFGQEHSRLLRLWETLSPKDIVCLGSGCLNDIPVQEFLEGGAEVTLVDWVPGLTQAGLARKIVYQTQQGKVCLCCRVPAELAQKICLNFVPPAEPRNLCFQFAANRDLSCFCSNYCPGPAPAILETDVSGGVGEQFAESVFSCLSRAAKPGGVLRQMKKVLDASDKDGTHLPLPGGAFDLAVSAMVVSQFCFEPLTYFARGLQARFPEPLGEPQQRRWEDLRQGLFRKMLAGHLDEWHRLLKPAGRVYLSFEVIHRDKGRPHWFVPDYAGAVLEEISRRFDLTEDLLPPDKSLSRMQVGEEESVVLSLVLFKA